LYRRCPIRPIRRFIPFVTLAALFFVSAPSLRAASVPFVGSVPVTDAPAAGSGEPGLTGPVLDSRSVPFLLLDPRFDAAHDLTLHNAVVRAQGTGALDFFYRVTNNSDRPLRLIDMDTGPFTRPDSVDPIDVNLWDDASGTYAPLRADREWSHFDGVAFQFPFFETLAAGESSRLFFIRTAATDYRLAGLTQFRSTPGTTSDNGFAVTFNPVLDGPIIPRPQPQVVVPLPAGAWIGGVVTVVFALMRWRRRAVQR
jgi:hypothetical protein